MQRGKVISYASRKLKAHDKNYPTHDLDLVVVVFELKIWTHYLHDFYLDVFTNHKSLQFVFTKKEVNLRQRRWLEFLNDYDMSVHYHPGKANVVAVDLSRLSMGSVAHVGGKNKGASEGCSQACLLGSLPYEHIRHRCKSSKWGQIVFGSGGKGKERD